MKRASAVRTRAVGSGAATAMAPRPFPGKPVPPIQFPSWVIPDTPLYLLNTLNTAAAGALSLTQSILLADALTDGVFSVDGNRPFAKGGSGQFLVSTGSLTVGSTLIGAWPGSAERRDSRPVRSRPVNAEANS